MDKFVRCFRRLLLGDRKKQQIDPEIVEKSLRFIVFNAFSAQFPQNFIR